MAETCSAFGMNLARSPQVCAGRPRAGKWVSQRREVGGRPDRRALAPEASSSVMMKTPLDERDARGRVNQEPTSDNAFALAASALAFAMLTLFAVLALAD